MKNSYLFKKKSLFSLLFVILLIFLAGCSGGDSTQVDNNGNVTNENGTTEEKVVEENIEDEVVNEEKTEAVEITDKNEAIKDKEEITYTLNGDTITETAKRVKNENLNYSMLILPNFDHDEEEPNRDIVSYKDNGEIFMRIEMLSDDVDWDTMIDNTKLEVESGEGEVTSIDPPNDPFFQDAIAFSSSDGEILKKAYLIKNEEFPVKLTLFMKEKEDFTDPFLKMAATITKE